MELWLSTTDAPCATPLKYAPVAHHEQFTHPQRQMAPVEDSLHLHILSQNINGRTNKGRIQRRECLKNQLRNSDCKPDFLALQDGVRWIDVRELMATLNERWEDSQYSHVAEKWTGHKHVQNDGANGYELNQEALLYDSRTWERLVDDHNVIRSKDLDLVPSKYRKLIVNRFRAGAFRHKDSEEVIFVVSYHGRYRAFTSDSDCMNIETRETAFQGIFPDRSF